MFEDNIPPENPDEEQEQEQKKPNIHDLENAKDKYDKFSKLAKGGKSPIPGGGASAAGEATGAMTGAGAGAAPVAAGAAPVAAAGSAPAWLVPALIIGLIILFIILIIIIYSYSQDNDTPAQVNITKSGPASVANGENISYTINASYPGLADDIIVRDTIPENTEFVSAIPRAKTLTASGAETIEPALIKKVEWSLKNILGTTAPSEFVPQQFSLTVRPLSDNTYIVNQATASVIGGDGQLVPTGPVPPNTNDCGGYYTNDIAKNLLKKNFGDPNCTLFTKTLHPQSRPEDKDKLFNLFKQLDPKYADYWFFVVVPCESNYNANAYGNHYDPVTHPDLDPNGAWGLLQMNSSLSTSIQYKNGDVNWELQVSNAVNYNNSLNLINPELKWNYWQCARPEPAI